MNFQNKKKNLKTDLPLKRFESKVTQKSPHWSRSLNTSFGLKTPKWLSPVVAVWSINDSRSSFTTTSEAEDVSAEEEEEINSESCCESCGVCGFCLGFLGGVGEPRSFGAGRSFFVRVSVGNWSVTSFSTSCSSSSFATSSWSIRRWSSLQTPPATLWMTMASSASTFVAVQVRLWWNWRRAELYKIYKFGILNSFNP